MTIIRLDFNEGGADHYLLKALIDGVKAGATCNDNFIQCGRYQAMKALDVWDVKITYNDGENWHPFSAPPWKASKEEILDILAFETAKEMAHSSHQLEFIDAIITTLQKAKEQIAKAQGRIVTLEKL